MEGENPTMVFSVLYSNLCLSIIAVLLGRLRLSIGEAIENFKIIWRHMAAGTTLAQKTVPGWKNKNANSRHLNEAFTDIVTNNLKLSLKRARLDIGAANEDIKDQFTMNAGLCRT